MQRPKSIIAFERLFFMSFVMAIFISFPSLTVSKLIAHIFISTLLISGLLLISRKRNKIAMWCFVALTLTTLPSLYHVLNYGLDEKTTWMSVLQALCQLSGIVMLTTPSSRKWMNGKNDESELVQVFS